MPRNSLLRNECLDDAQASQSLLYLAHAVAQARLHEQRTSLEPPAHRAYTPCQEGYHEQREERKLPTDADERHQIDHYEDGVLHYHIERAAYTGIHLIDVRRYARQYVTLTFIGEETQGQADDLTVDIGPDVTDDTRAQRHEHGRTAKVSGCLEEGEHAEHESEQQQGGGWTVALDELLRVEVAVVLGYIDKRTPSPGAPRYECEMLVIDLEEYLQYRKKDGEGEYVEERSQHIHQKCAGDKTFVTGKVAAHCTEEFPHDRLVCYFRPKSAGISPHWAVSHLITCAW